MLVGLARKARQVAMDKVLRRYLIARALGRGKSAPSFVAHQPPYMSGFGRVPLSAAPIFDIAPERPGAPIRFALHNQDFFVDPDHPGRLFDDLPKDVETRLALHRFAWLAGAGAPDPATVAAVWRAWFARFGTSDDAWAWHPYTAVERVVALLNFADRHYWPGGDARALLARHADVIQAQLEYFGEHHTSNHLANNGRGLAHLGLRLRDPALAEVGLRILVEEARRIFLPSGVLREGSTHYHLLYAARYAEMAALAGAHGRSEAQPLASIAARALAVIPHFLLPGGLPLVGDISPDIPPAELDLPPLPEAVEADLLCRDGWVRLDRDDWAGLWHAAPQGWSHMPGHGHQDCGSCELHWRGLAVFIDPGRGAYGEEGEAAFYRSAQAHNGLTLDGVDPYPANRPYYDEDFRRAIGGLPPVFTVEGDDIRLGFAGYGRLGAPWVDRRWTLSSTLVIEDSIEGRGRHRIERRLHTAFPVRHECHGRVVVETPAGRLRVSADTALTLEARTHWLAYGHGVPATAIVASVNASLPWRGRMTVDIA